MWKSLIVKPDGDERSERIDVAVLAVDLFAVPGLLMGNVGLLDLIRN